MKTSAPTNHEFLYELHAQLLTACDTVFGSVVTTLTVVAAVLHFTTGTVGLGTVIALAFIVVFNVTWTKISANRDRFRADLLRTPISLPSVTYLYIAEQSGPFERMWIPALVMTVGVCLEVSSATRRPLIGYIVTLANSLALLLATLISGGAIEHAWKHALGIVLTGLVMSMVGAKLGSVLDEARRQRDDAKLQYQLTEAALAELAATHAQLQAEMDYRSRVEVELRQAQKLESVGRLAAGVAHEINTPIQYITDNLHFVRDATQDLMAVVDQLPAGAAEQVDLPYLHDHLPDALARSLEGTERVANIVRAMKTFAHPGGTEMAPSDLNHAIESTLTVARSEYKLVADVETAFGDLPRVTCHIGEINQVVLNLLVNAAHAIADANAGKDRRGRITVRTTHDRDHVVIAISDTGGGIPETIRDRIFDPFFTTKDVGRGSGQGLAVGRSIVVDKHHGELTFTTELGAGTTFFVRLPVHGTAKAAA